MPVTYSIAEVNRLSQAEFVDLLGVVFEETPAIARQAWQARPFSDVSALHQAMVAVVEQWPEAQQLSLIQAHPDLGSRAQMAEASVAEQAEAGLSQLSLPEYERFQQLNAAYQEKFGFPFVMAVKGHGKESILSAFEARSNNTREAEIARSLSEIFQIARFRLDASIH